MKQRMSFTFAAWFVASAAWADGPPPDAPAGAEAPPPLQVYEEVEVRDRADDMVGIATSATEGSTGAADLAKRPILRPGELVETTPGVVATQHSGGGKANQFFLRGFNLDHGTDFSVKVDGVPVNLPTHGHGQGYADLNFLIPELVDRVRYRKGPYYADLGDFSAAGGLDVDLVDNLPAGLLTLTGGSYDYGRILWAESFDLDGSALLTAVDLFHNDGPWRRGEDYEGWKGLVRWSRGDAQRGLTVTAMGYSADWLSTDQIPHRAVEDGSLDRFDLVDEGPRGQSERMSLSLQARRGSHHAFTRLAAHLVASDFDLVSNFTYFLDDEEGGDQFVQKDRRTFGGFELHHTWLGRLGKLRLENTAGLELRFDAIDNGLFRSRDTLPVDTVRSDDVDLLKGGPFVETLVHLHDKVRLRAGLRAEGLTADVTSDLAANSGSADDTLLAPKLSLIVGPFRATELYFNYGHGFHSNDARGATLRLDPVSGEPGEPVDPLVRARGVDVGLRTTAIPRLHSTLTLFQLELDSELVFVGDGGATEASRPSRRRGVEWTNVYQANRWLGFDFDLTWADGQFTDEAPEGEEIPGSIGRTVAAGIALDDLHGFFGALRWRYFGDVPLIEDGSTRWSSSSLVNARLGYEFPNGLEVALEIFNLLDREDSDVEYFYPSRLPGETSGGVDDVHFHPLEGRSARLVATWRGFGGR